MGGGMDLGRGCWATTLGLWGHSWSSVAMLGASVNLDRILAQAQVAPRDRHAAPGAAAAPGRQPGGAPALGTGLNVPAMASLPPAAGPALDVLPGSLGSADWLVTRPSRWPHGGWGVLSPERRPTQPPRVTCSSVLQVVAECCCGPGRRRRWLTSSGTGGGGCGGARQGGGPASPCQQSTVRSILEKLGNREP